MLVVFQVFYFLVFGSLFGSEAEAEYLSGQVASRPHLLQADEAALQRFVGGAFVSFVCMCMFCACALCGRMQSDV